MKELIKSFTYGEDIKEKTAVKFSQEGIVVKATQTSDKVCGVTLFSGKKDAKADVLMFGLGIVSTTGAVNAGDFLVADSDGKLKALSVEDENGLLTVVGRVLETASTAAKLSAFINPQLLNVQVLDQQTEDGQE